MTPVDHHLERARTSIAMGHNAEAVRQLELALSALHVEVQKAFKTAREAANTASCLANGILPD